MVDELPVRVALSTNFMAQVDEHVAGDGALLVANTPAVSWLLCTHVINDQLRQALHSCLDQTFSDFEVVVVANGPVAEDVATAVHGWFEGDSRVRVFTTEVRHLIFSLSLGLHHARAPLVARMDADDLSKPDRLERQVAFMRAHPEVCVLGSAYEVIDNEGRAQATVRLPTNDAQIRAALVWGNPLCHPSVMFRRKAVLAVGGYLGSLHAEDYDLWARLSVDAENHFANLEDVVLSYRSVGVGMARRSRFAYATVAAAQLRNFINGQGVRWLAAAFLTSVKAMLRSSPARRRS
jgi:cellulose synthase/poly-beta-1,6-N-acetylglucosamine synthase-like glycosyltransferase